MFLWYDYLTFILMVLISVLIGIYFGCFGTRQSTTSEYLFGGKQMKTFTVGLSIAMSNFSALSLMGVPADIYKNGSTVLCGCLSFFVAGVILYYVYMPVFFELQLTSFLEYLKRRFDNRTRFFALVLTILSANLFLAAMIYAPSLYFSTVSGINVHLISVVVCGSCVFYTTIGGLRTVVWTDVFQFVVLAASLLSVAIIGARSEGLMKIWNKSSEGGRIDFEFSPDPTILYSFWSVTSGYLFCMVYAVGLHQTGMQKLLALRSYLDSFSAVIYYAISFAFLIVLCTCLGLEMYARYADCDPFLNKELTKHDQLVPHYIAKITKNIPGISGIFMAAIFSASFSSISSNLNSLSGVIYKDFLYKFLSPATITSDKSRSGILKLIVLVQGIVAIALSVVAEHLGPLFALSFTSVALSYGPLLGIFTLGILFPRANAIGAFYGAIGASIVSGSVIFSANYYQMKGFVLNSQKSFSVESCNTTAAYFNNHQDSWKPHAIFSLSFMYYIPLGAVSAVILGLVLSYLTNKNDPPVEEILISPVGLYFFKRSRTTSFATDRNCGEQLHPLKTNQGTA